MKAQNTENQNYYSNVRSDILAMVEGTGLRLLEVGCGSGSTLLHAKQTGIASKIVGVEYVTDVAKIAQERGVQNIYTGDFSLVAKKISTQEGRFDTILFGDVLEHMIDPWTALAQAKDLLVDGGQIVASVPNFRYWRVMYNVFFRGNFRYESDGIMDRTHLRFFCRRNILEMISDQFEIVREHAVLPKSGKLLNVFSLGLLKEFGTLQYVVSARKIHH